MEIKGQTRNLPFLAVGVLLVVILAILILKAKLHRVDSSGNLPQAQLSQALEAGKPVLAFYHSNNCRSCVEMVQVVNLVYPEFSNSVVLVDVNVYDPQNRGLLQEIGLRFIPTMVFYDPLGKSQTVVGVMDQDQLRKAFVLIQKGD